MKMTTYMVQPQKVQLLLGTDWEKSTTDGYYYYKKAVNAEESTTQLVSEITTTGQAPDGYSLSVIIYAEAIQIEENQKAIKDAWRMDSI